MLNDAIKDFPYTNSDKINSPQMITKAALSKDSVRGNGHENWCLIRLLPLLIGHYVPEGDESWEVLLCLKDVLELTMFPSFTEETVQYLDFKLVEHRDILQGVFSDYRLRPKHHYLEHYPGHNRVFGPLVDVWTMRFEAKHKLLKRTVREAHNFKNVAWTVAERHQKTIAYYLDSASFL